MDELWNDIRFTSPPVYTYKCFDKSLDVLRFHTIISDAVSILENQQILHREAAIISRLVYTMGRKFRHDIGHSYVRRTNIALLKYLNLNYSSDLKNLLSVVPESFSENYLYVPTRQMAEYILVRTQTLAKILFRINMCAKKATLFYFERLKRGDSAWLSVMPYSVLSRVWLLTKTFLKNVCKWYNNMLPFAYKLNHVGATILPSDYDFPKDLSLWISIKELDVQSTNLWQSCNILSLINDTEVQQDIPNVYDIPAQEFMTPNIQTDTTFTQRRVVESVVEDVGEKISRNEFVKTFLPKNYKNDVKESSRLKKKIKSQNATNKTSKENSRTTSNIVAESKHLGNSSKHHLKSVKCLMSLKMFLKAEENLRIHNSKHALSKNVGIIQWESVKKIICKKMLKLFKKTPGVSPDVVSNTFQCLWSEKCT